MSTKITQTVSMQLIDTLIGIEMKNLSRSPLTHEDRIAQSLSEEILRFLKRKKIYYRENDTNKRKIVIKYYLADQLMKDIEKELHYTSLKEKEIVALKVFLDKLENRMRKYN